MTSSQISDSKSLLDLILKNDGDSPAILDSSGSVLTYAELQQQVASIGESLRAFGINRGDVVAVVLPNGPEMATSFLGVASFATCAPLNPNFVDKDFEFYLQDLDAKAVVLSKSVDSPVRNVTSRLGLTLIEIDTPADAKPGQFLIEACENDGSGKIEPATSDDIAMILHTSGTTSRPKMVPLSHRNLMASATAIAETLKLASADRCLNVMPLFHIHGLVGALLSSLAAGASVICTAGFDRDGFLGWLRGCRPTWYSAVPTIHQAVLTLQTQASETIEHSLRLIRSSSSALPPQVMANVQTMFGVPVIESYGMTEAAHQMASNPLPPKERIPGSVGLAAGPEVAIMDDAGELVDKSVAGEIVIKGPNVTAGYLNNPEANKTAFQNGWFRTGDLGYLDENGYLFINGRKKEMILRGGENISPREIDEALLQHEGVAQAVAFAVPHSSLGEDVAAAVVLKPDAGVRPQQLREFTASLLTDFKVPSQIIVIDEIPKGPTGKLQRIGLHEKLSEKLHAAFAAPESMTEQTVHEFWQVVFPDIERIGIDDNFFFLGGDSLLGTRLASRINTAFEIDLDIGELFREPTIRGQAGFVEAKLIDQIAGS